MHDGGFSPVTVRPYEARDQAGVEWLYSRTPPWGRSYVRPEPVPPEITGIASQYEHVFLAVAPDRDGEAVVGLTTVSDAHAASNVGLPEFIDLGRRVARLNHVLVAPERWRQGIGRRLVAAAVAWAAAAGYDAVALDTTAEQRGAIEFYRALGFREAGRTRFREWELVWFELRLAGRSG
jgi:GNAT superfamily N-acetyltransferase